MIRGDDDNAVDDGGGAVPCGAVLFCAVLQKPRFPFHVLAGKRGFVRDIACVWMCSVYIWTSPNECIPNQKSPEIPQGFPMIDRLMDRVTARLIDRLLD